MERFPAVDFIDDQNLPCGEHLYRCCFIRPSRQFFQALMAHGSQIVGTERSSAERDGFRPQPVHVRPRAARNQPLTRQRRKQTVDGGLVEAGRPSQSLSPHSGFESLKTLSTATARCTAWVPEYG